MSFGHSMPKYFKQMDPIGKALNNKDEENLDILKGREEEIESLIKKVEDSGATDEDMNKRGIWTAKQRIASLVDEGTWCPLHSLYNPSGNKNGSTSIIDGLGRIDGRWVMILASDNKKIMGAWVPGQAENILRALDTAERLHIPVVWLLNCSGVQLDVQELVYANRRGGGTPFFRHAALQQAGVPIIVGIYGTNPAGGGYHSISPTVLIAHKDANMAVGGAGIVGGMNPKGFVDEEGAEALIKVTKETVSTPPGRVEIHHNETGFFREVAGTEEEVLEEIKKYVRALPAYDKDFFRVDDPKDPAFSPVDLYSLVPANQRKIYDVKDILARLLDSSEVLEFKEGYGPEMFTGLAKVSGLLVGVVANVQGFLMNYPDYYEENKTSIGGKLYRQGLIKMSEFVTFCSRDKIPMIWIQDTTGIDVGDIAEKAEMLGLGQSLIYSIQNSNIPQMEITLRKGTAAAHYVLGGPQGETNAFSLGTVTTEMNVMNGETAAAAMYSRRLVKDKDSGKPLTETIDKMNKLIDDYKEKSTPEFCAKLGLVDEVVNFMDIRKYMVAFTESAYQNPTSICAFHQMLTPRACKESKQN